MGYMPGHLAQMAQNTPKIHLELEGGRSEGRRWGSASHNFGGARRVDPGTWCVKSTKVSLSVDPPDKDKPVTSCQVDLGSLSTHLTLWI